MHNRHLVASFVTGALLLCALSARAADIYARCRVVNPPAAQYRITAAGFIHQPNWYLPAKTQTVTGADTWSDWFDLTDWPLHGKLDREGGLAEWPAMTLKVAVVGSATPVAGCTFEVQLADAASTAATVLTFSESSGSDTIGFLLPNPLRANAGEFETGTQMTNRQLNWALAATNNTAYLPKQFNLITSLWSVFDPTLIRKHADTLLQLGTSTIGGVPTDIMKEKNLQTYGVTWHLLADPEQSAAVWAAGDGAAIANQLATPDGLWRAQHMLHYVVCDETQPLDFRSADAAKLNGWFHDYLRNMGETDASMGTPIDGIAYPASLMYDAVLPKTADLTTRKIDYYAGKFGQYWTAQQMRQTSDLVKASFAPIGGMQTETLPSDHDFFNAWGAPYCGMGYRGLDFFEMGKQHSVDILSAEDWMGLNHMYGPFATWGGQHAFGYLSAIFRSSIGDSDMKLRALITPSDGGYLRLKAYDALAQGCKSIFFWTFGPTFVSTENYWSDLRSEYDGVANVARALTLSEPVMYTAKTVSDPVALLYSVSHDMWHTDDPACFVENRLTWTGLRHLGIQPDILREEDITAAKLASYRALYITSECVSRQASAAIDAWVQNGGIVYLTAGAATRDEFYTPYTPPFAATVWPDDASTALFKQTGHSYNDRADLPTITPITQANTSAGAVKVIGYRLDLRPTLPAGQVTATFADNGAIAGATAPYGTGSVVAYGFLPGLAYSPYTLNQSTLDEVWPAAPRALMAQPLATGGITGVVTPDVPVVETSLLTGPQGAAIVLINQTYQPIASLKLTVRNLPPFSTATTVEGSAVTIKRLSPTECELTLPLAWTDIILLPLETTPAPFAGDDSYATPQSTPLTVAAPGVLGNDTGNGGALAAAKVTDPAHGALTLQADGGFTYMPETDYVGADSFTYKAHAGTLDSNIATVSLTVNPTAGWEGVAGAQAYRANGEPVTAAPDGTYFCEAEEFQPEQSGWNAKPWGQNYYCATFANTFLSRKAYLSAPAQCGNAVSTINVNVQTAGNYLVLARYEAVYRFETQFTVRVEQNGNVVFNRLYGARANTKIWAFGEKLKTEVAWPWGADENMVWEGHDASVNLQPGLAKISLIAGAQPDPGALRNVDLLMLTRDTAQVTSRINTESYLPLDGWLTQAGDVYLRATNTGGANATVSSLSFSGGPFQQHSPYWVHQRNWSPVSFLVAPGQTSNWTEVGGTMDTLNDGQWGFRTTGSCSLELGVKNAAGVIQSVRTFANVNGALNITGNADTRYTRTFNTPAENTNTLMTALNAVSAPGRTPTQTMIAASGSLSSQIDPLFGTEGYYMAQPKLHADLRGMTPAQLTAWCQALTPEQRANYLFISLGDEIGNGMGNKPLTDVLRSYLPNAGIGANYSPQNDAARCYLGNVSDYITTFRTDAMTMPWSEDFCWGMPIGSPQVNGIDLDLFRDGVRGKPHPKIMMYVMPHSPGNIPDMWKRMWFSAMGHGANLFNLFEFDPVYVAYTENYVNDPAMYTMVLKTLREYGMYEDIVQQGQRKQSQVALWFSQAGDSNTDYANSGGAGKRALYLAILNQHLPLDVLSEADTQDGTIGQYNVLYLTDRHVSQAASQQIAAWVQAGGRLFATAGAGMYDENNGANTTLRALLGVTETAFETPADSQVGFEKQDLPFAVPADQVTASGGAFPVFGAVSRFTAAGDTTVLGTFSDGSPAVTQRAAGAGQVIYCGFLPGLSYLKPAIPFQPVDRGDLDTSMAQFLPVNCDAAVGALVGSIAPAETRQVVTSQPYVEAAVIESPVGTAIALTNWSTTPVGNLQVAVNFPVPTADVSLASGQSVSVRRSNGQTIFSLNLAVADTLILRGGEGLPTADPQTVETAEDTAKAITLTGGDPNALPLTFDVATQPANGKLTGTAPDLTYTPADDYVGPDSFTFTVSNGQATSTPATVSITVTPVNDAPVANDDEYTTPKNTPRTVDMPGVLGNDTDVDSTTLTAIKVTDPAHGLLALNADGGFTYTPEKDYDGPDSFTYQANDGELDSNIATVSITVAAVNQGPTADPQTVETDVNTAKDITLTGSDPDGDPLTFDVATQPANGKLTGTAPDLTYTPADDYVGPDSFTFTVSDGQATSEPATVSITVNPVNHDPTADPQDVATEENVAKDITLTGSDPDGDQLTFDVATQPTNGKLTGTAPDLTYTPDTDYVGPDSFTFTVSDGQATSAPATVSITVTAINHAPKAFDSELGTEEDTPVDGVMQATDPDGDPLTFHTVVMPEHGEVVIHDTHAGTFTYTPDPNYNGPDALLFFVGDGQLESNIATVSFFVSAVNDPPAATPRQVTTAEDTAVNITLAGSDPDGDPLTFDVVTQPANGELTGTAPNLTYTPAPNYHGPDSFTFTVSDGRLTSAPAAVGITVTPVNDTPAAQDGAFAVPTGAPVPGTLAATDVDGDPLTFRIVANGAKGTAVITNPATGAFTYTPRPGLAGIDTFTFVANDGQVDSNVATMSASLAGSPLAVDDFYRTPQQTTLLVVMGGVLANDIDPQGKPLTAELVTSTAHGLLLFKPDGWFMYIPAAGFLGTDTFTYRANDGTELSNVATVSIEVYRRDLLNP